MKKIVKRDSKPLDGLKILFADDEPSIQEVMSLELPRMGHEATVCPDGLTAVAALERNSYDCVLVDLDMPGLNGIQVIQRAKELAPETEAVVLTGKSSLDTAVAALRQGAFDYLTKPCKLVELESLLSRIAQKRELTNQYRALKQRLDRIEGNMNLVGSNDSMERVRQLIAKVAPTHSTVLILGETGTGKELVARALHEQSLRADKPFVPVNCGALPESADRERVVRPPQRRVYRRRRAPRGPVRSRPGRQHLPGRDRRTAQGDAGQAAARAGKRRDPADRRQRIPPDRRAGHLRHAPQPVRDGRRRRLPRGSDVPHQHLRDPPAAAAAADRRHPGLGRAPVPPLPALRAADQEAFTPEAIRLLKSHSWPGNVRELANVIEHATILCDEPPISPEHLPRSFNARGVRMPDLGPVSLRDLEMHAIQQSLDRHDGNKAVAAEELGVSLKTLYNKLNQAQEAGA